MTCDTCRHFDREAIAYPELGERCGSARLCPTRVGVAHSATCEGVTYSGSWCTAWELVTPEQQGVLFQ